MSEPQRRFVVHAAVQCLGTVAVDGEVSPSKDPELYELLAAWLGPHLAGWEHGDTIWLAASSRSIEGPDYPEGEYRLSTRGPGVSGRA